VDDFYAARDNTMPSLPWPSIAPPFTLESAVAIVWPISTSHADTPQTQSGGCDSCRAWTGWIYLGDCSQRRRRNGRTIEQSRAEQIWWSVCRTLRPV